MPGVRSKRGPVHKPNELAPRTLKLASLARRRLVAFMDHVERQLAPNGPLAAIRLFAHKVPEHAARLGGVLALVDELDVEEISGHHLEAGILLAEHYTAEARRPHDAGQSDPDLDLAQRVLDWLTLDWPGNPLISVPDLYTYGPGPVRDEQNANRIIDILEDHGWLLREGAGTRPGERHHAARGLAPGIRGWSMSGYQRFLPRDATRMTVRAVAEVAEAAEVQAQLKGSALLRCC